jgi:integrase
MSLYKRPDSKVWWYQFSFNNKRIQRSSNTTNKRAASEIEAAYRVKLARGEADIDTPIAAPTVRDFSDRFLKHVRVECAAKPKTVGFYEDRTASLLRSKLADSKLTDITADDITDYKSASRNSIATTNRDLATLRRMLNLAQEWDVALPRVKVKLSPGEDKRDFVLSEPDEAKYLAACTPLLHRVAVVMLDCGLRPDEIFPLRHEQCRDNTISILRGKRSASRRSVEVTPRVAEAIGQGFGFVFGSEDTKEGHITRDTLKKAHERAIKDAGVERFVIYSLRHTCLTRWAVAGMDASTLMYLAGHECLATTMRYIHLAAHDAQKRLRAIRATTFSTTGEKEKLG